MKYVCSQEAAEAAKKKGKILRPGLPPVMIFWKQRRRSAASGIICFFLFNLHDVLFTKVWKGIFSIQDLTKIWCGIRHNARYLYGKRDLTASAKWNSTPEFGHGKQDFLPSEENLGLTFLRKMRSPTGKQSVVFPLKAKYGVI